MFGVLCRSRCLWSWAWSCAGVDVCGLYKIMVKRGWIGLEVVGVRCEGIVRDDDQVRVSSQWLQMWWLFWQPAGELPPSNWWCLGGYEFGARQWLGYFWASESGYGGIFMGFFMDFVFLREIFVSLLVLCCRWKLKWLFCGNFGVFRNSKWRGSIIIWGAGENSRWQLWQIQRVTMTLCDRASSWAGLMRLWVLLGIDGFFLMLDCIPFVF